MFRTDIPIVVNSRTSAKIMRVRITRPSKVRSNFRKVKRAIRDASSRSCEAARAAAAAAAERSAAAAAFRFPRGHETRRPGQRRACLDRQISRVFQRGERARAAALADGMRARRVPASPGALRARCVWHGIAWYGMVWIYTRTRARIRRPANLSGAHTGPAPPIESAILSRAGAKLRTADSLREFCPCSGSRRENSIEGDARARDCIRRGSAS